MAVFTVQLTDEVSGPAKAATGSVSSLAAEFDALQKSMAGAGGWGGISDLQAKNLAFHQSNVKGAKSEKDILAEIAAEQKKNLGAHDDNAAADAGHNTMAKAAAEAKRESDAAFASIASGADSAAESMAGLTAVWEEWGPLVTAVGQAVGFLAGKLYEAAEMAVRLTQEKDQLRATFDVLNGAGSGGALLDELEDLSSELPFTADKLNGWAKALLAAGIKGDALKTSIRAIAAATAIMGESGGQAAQGLIKRFAMMAESGQKVSLDRRILSQLAEAGISVGALAKALGVAPSELGKMKVAASDLGNAMQKALIAQGEGPLKTLGNTWGTISAKLREGFEDAFEDLGDLVGPFMAELQSLASEFYAGGVAGQDWKDAIRAALTGAFKVATEFVNFIHRGFLHAQVALLQFRIAIAPITSVLSQIGIGSAGVSVALYLLKGTVVVLAIVFGLLALAVALVALPFVLAGIAIYLVGSAISYLVGLISGAIDNFGNLKAAAADAGSGIITGLGNAIASGSAWVIGLISGLAASMIGAITGPLGIKSPSRVMMRLGAYTTEGLATGISAGVPDVQASARSAGMATIDGTVQGAQGGAGATAGKGAAGGRTFNLHIEKLEVHGNGSPLEVTEEALALVLEKLTLQAGI